MTLRERLDHVRERRRALTASIDAFGQFETWEETCVPSYVHPNPAAAAVSWWRLFAAVSAAKAHTRWGPVLDFGASVGELAHVLPAEARPYWFIEQEEPAAKVLASMVPDAVRTTLEEAPEGRFAAVFALDSLEHNPNYGELLDALRPKLAPSGILVLSGPTENALYRLGRRIAGFDSHYHETNIHAIEERAASTYERVAVHTVPIGVPLFRISVWRGR
ncbi:MAG: methyltransferase domain-containing protein [Alphaproteobacteria bacterium]|nr:methyltransferase domain-containing protein [Alphaproteobacteria bacterium]MCB9697738.1 methyltransferase domain-containing protein [Alphaproteobacteria bacterium]